MTARTRDKRQARKPPPRRDPVKARRAEVQFTAQLKKVAKNIGDIIDGFPAGNPSALPPLTAILESYSKALEEWARGASLRMLTEVNRRDRDAFLERSQDISQALRDEIRNADTGRVMQSLMAEQVDLIKSLPLEAAERVHKLTIEGLQDSTRAAEIAKEIARSGEVTESRAVLIARTEVARTAAKLTEARALSIGSTHYIWRTVGDSDVRSGHKHMNGKVFAWNDPPMVNEGSDKRPNWLRHHPGEIWNCRCYAEPILAKE
ncbi:phage head morphogenesis protein [Achromobacter sp. HZ28]|nr:phage head morphogenesis protein [Achromobacter sp. HZ34]OWT70624.1 phage head morphogenesis protein [Achromobacter sp. HZ28]